MQKIKPIYSFRYYIKLFLSILLAALKKTIQVSKETLKEYIFFLTNTLKFCGTIVIFGFLIGIASSVYSGPALGIAIAGLFLVSLIVIACGRWSTSWFLYPGIASAIGFLLLGFLVAAGYSDAVFGVSIFIFVAMPLMLIVLMIVPLTMLLEMMSRIYPDGREILAIALQSLFSAFFTMLFLSILFLVLPPLNPLAIIFIIPIMTAIAIILGINIGRNNPKILFNPPVLGGLAISLVVLLWLMSMPNLRNTIRHMPKKLDYSIAGEIQPVFYSSSKEIDFVAQDGASLIWYAETKDGGFLLFKSEGVGPYYMKDGTQLKRADDETSRHKIEEWIDQTTAKKIESDKKKSEENALKDNELKLTEAENKEQERLSSYMSGYLLPKKVDFIVYAITTDDKQFDSLASALTDKLNKKGKTASSMVFSAEFATEGGFDKFKSGKAGKDIKKLLLSKKGEKILLLKCNQLSINKSQKIPGLYSSSMTVSVNEVDAFTGQLINVFQLSSVGPGTSGEDAKNSAFNDMLEKLDKKIL